MHEGLESSASFDQFAGEDDFLGHLLVGEYADQCLYDVVAQRFEMVVDACQLRLAACAEYGVVVADDRQFARYGQPLLVRIFDGADGEIVVGGYDSPVFEGSVKLCQEIRDRRKVCVVSREILHVFHAQREPLLCECALVARQFSGRREGL